METVKWEKRYETGVEDIDLQHHYFLNLINHFIVAIKNKEDVKNLKALGDELNAYARFHFSSEERMMVKSDYPDYELHKKHHIDLIQKLGIEEYRLVNATHIDDASEVIDFLIQWFINHTTNEDKLFANYLLSKQNKES